MSNYNNGPRYTRPPGSERPGPRFHAANQRHPPRNQFNDFRPQQQSNPNNTVQTPPKPPSETNLSTASVTQLAMAQPMTTTPELNSVAASTQPKTETTSPELNSTINDQRPMGPGGQKRPAPVDTTTQGGRSRLFIGNISPDITQDEFQKVFQPYGKLVEFFVNPTRGFGFIKLASRQIAERIKHDLDGHVLRGKALRIRFASQGAIVKVKNLSPNVSNELLKETFEQYFGNVERAVVIVDDRGRSIGEGIVEFEKKPSAQKCLTECTERCFFISSTLKPIIVEPWDTKDEEDGLPEKSLVKNDVYQKERDLKPHFAEPNTIEQTIGLKWKELELQEKQLLDEVKRRMQFASEQLQVEIDQMLLDHQAQLMREELARREEDLRRLNERRSIDFDRRRQMMPMHPQGDMMYPSSASMPNNPYPMAPAYHEAMPPAYSFMPGGPNAGAPMPPPPPPPPPMVEANYTTHQMARAYNHHMGHEYNNQPAQMFDRKRRRN